MGRALVCGGSIERICVWSKLIEVRAQVRSRARVHAIRIRLRWVWLLLCSFGYWLPRWQHRLRCVLRTMDQNVDGSMEQWTVLMYIISILDISSSMCSLSMLPFDARHSIANLNTFQSHYFCFVCALFQTTWSLCSVGLYVCCKRTSFNIHKIDWMMDLSSDRFSSQFVAIFLLSLFCKTCFVFHSLLFNFLTCLPTIK